MVYLAKDEYEKAIYYFNKCISINGSFAGAYNNIGLALFKDQKVSNSILFFEKAIILDDKFYDAYINLAKAYKANSKYSGAIKILNKLQNVSSSQLDKASALSMLAQCYIHVGSFQKDMIFMKNH